MVSWLQLKNGLTWPRNSKSSKIPREKIINWTNVFQKKRLIIFAYFGEKGKKKLENVQNNTSSAKITVFRLSVNE